MFSKLGTSVAIEMEKILSSDAYANLFYKPAAHECVCTPDCHCYEDGPCAGHCPCIKPEKSEEKKSEAAAKCKCEKDCTDCKCSKKNGEWECECLAVEKKKEKEKEQVKKKSQSLQDLSYTFSKVSADLDDAGYVKTSIAVLRVLECLIAEAMPPKMPSFPETDEPEYGGAEMSADQIGMEDISEELQKVIELLEQGNEEAAHELATTVTDAWEPHVTGEMPPPPVEELAETEMGEYEPLLEGATKGTPEVLELEMANKEIDKWLAKNAQIAAVHRVDRLDPKLELDLDLKDLLIAEDGIETNLIDAYLAELDSSFEDED